MPRGVPSSCALSGSGCTFVGRYDSIHDHERRCDYQLRLCSNKGCDFTGTVKDMPQHEVECGCGRVRCPDCGSSMLRKRAALHDCTRDMLKAATRAMKTLGQQFQSMEAHVTGELAELSHSVDRRLAAMTLKLERMHSMVYDRLSQSKERNEILEAHEEVMKVGRAYRLKSHRGEFVCPAPTPGILAPPPEGHWTCCRQKVKVSWCLIPPEEQD